MSDIHVCGMSFSNIFILLCKVGNVLENRDFAVKPSDTSLLECNCKAYKYKTFLFIGTMSLPI